MANILQMKKYEYLKSYYNMHLKMKALKKKNFLGKTI